MCRCDCAEFFVTHACSRYPEPTTAVPADIIKEARRRAALEAPPSPLELEGASNVLRACWLACEDVRIGGQLADAMIALARYRASVEAQKGR